jgi:hypothetical protein
VASTARAAEVPLYGVTVPLKGTTDADRNAALGEALREVVVRASGRRDAARNPVVSKNADGASRLVQQYSATPSGELRAGFEPDTIDEILSDAGLPSWPSERPVTLVVMAGATRGHALRAGDSSPGGAAIAEAARARGVPLVWPVAEVTIETIRARLDASGVEAAARTAGVQADAVLLATGSDGQTDWVIAHGADTARRRGSPADGAHLAADTFAEIYAPDSTRSLSTASVRIDGVESLQAYAGLLKELDSISMVRGIAVGEIQGSTVRFDLTLRGDLALLRRITALTPALKPTDASDPAAPQFIYTP